MDIPKSGYLAQFSIVGIPTFVHWSFPVYGFLIAFFLNDSSLPTLFAAIASYVMLVATHEFGHAFFAWRSGMGVHAVIITGGGGYCIAKSHYESALDGLLFHAGGLLFQLVAFALALGFILVFGSPQSRVLGCLLFVFTYFNALLFVGNLVPYKDNDGAAIQKSLRELRRLA